MAPPSSILLVEDAEFQALMLRGLLETGGVEYDVVHVSTLADALSCVRSAPVACVLLDLTLPDATGLEAVVALRNEAPDVAIVVTTADEDEGRAIKAMQLGAQDYLSKTTVNVGAYCFDAAALLEALGELGDDNAQGEYYLTDVFATMAAKGLKTDTVVTPNLEEALGVNDPVALAFAEKLDDIRYAESLYELIDATADAARADE